MCLVRLFQLPFRNVFVANIDRETIQSAMNTLEEELVVSNFKKYESGRARDVFLLESGDGRELVLYLCTDTGDYEERFKKEEKLIELVNKKTDIPTQKIIKSDFSKETVPYLFYIAEKVDGYDPIDRFKYLPREVKKKIVREVGRYLGELHREIEFEDSGELRYIEGGLEIEGQDWSEFIQEQAEEKIEGIRDTRFEDLTDKLEKFIQENIDLISQESHSCLHWDITPDNIIVENSEINAVIDWEKAISGPPEWDLAYSRVQMIYRWFEDEGICKELEKEFFKGYIGQRELKGRWKQKILYYGMIQSMNSMTDFQNWTENMDKAQRKEEEKFLRELFSRRFRRLENAADEEIHL